MQSSLYQRVFFLLFLCCHLNADARHKLSIHYKIEDGLLSNTIYAILQDQKGFIWISTDNGVCRFDGQKFKRYSTANGLPDNDILSMEIDGKDRIWLSTFNKNLCFIQNGEVHTRSNDANLANFKQSSYLKFLARLQSSIVIVDDGNGNVYEVVESGEIKKNSSLRHIVNIGSYYVKRNGHKLECYTHQHHFSASCDLSAIDTAITGIYANGKDSFLIISAATAFQGVVRDGIPSVNPEKVPKPSGILFSRSNQLWYINENNVMQLYAADSIPLNRQYVNLNLLTVTYFFIDRKGGHWIGTKGDGVYYYPNIDMEYYSTSDGLRNENAFFSCVNGGELYVLLADGKIQKIKGQQVDNSCIDVSAFCGGKINRFFVNDQYVVAGSDIGCLYCYDKRNASGHCSDKFASIKDIENDYGNNVLLATSSQVSSLNLATHESKTILQERHTCVKRLNEDFLLAGGVNFLRLIHCPAYRVQNDSIYIHKQFSLKNLTVSDIQTDRSAIAMATVENGVFLYMNNRLHHLSIENGLTDNNCKSIYFDSAHNMWISTARGLNKVSLDESKQRVAIEQYTTFSGLTTNNINCVNQLGNYMYAAGSKGIIQFPDNYLQISKDQPLVYITEVNINGRITQGNPETIVVQPDSNDIKVDYAGIEFKSLGHIRYFYKIDELMDKWKEVNGGFSIDRLAPGTYRLEIQALSAYKRWSAHSATLRITILPYWWQQRLFKWLVAAIGIFLISFITRYILNKQYKRRYEDEKMKQQLIEVELKALKAQINPHFIFNTLNAIQYFIQNGENERADNYLNKMSKLIRSTLTFSNEAYMALSDELDYIENYLALESLRFDDDFHYTISRNISLPLHATPIPTMVLQPHIENAIRHGLKPKKSGTKQLTLTVNNDEQYIICIIEDNGIGRKKSQEINRGNASVNTSQGFLLAHAKLDMFRRMFKKDVQLIIDDLYEDAEPAGTRITIKIQK